MSNHIKYLKVEGFKTLRKASLPFGKLNLFLGLNGMGKSSTLQVLLMLRQSFGVGKNFHVGGEGDTLFLIAENAKIYLNKDLVQLGLMEDVLSRNSEKEEISIELGTEDGQVLPLNLPYNPDTDVLSGVIEVQDESGVLLFSSNIFSRDFQYLSAERKGPASIWEMSYVV